LREEKKAKVSGGGFKKLNWSWCMRGGMGGRGCVVRRNCRGMEKKMEFLTMIEREKKPKNRE